MTEEEWLATIHTDPLLAFLQGKASARKLRLFACACCRRIEHLLSFPEFIRAVEVAERYTDGGATEDELHRANKIVDDYYMSATPENDYRDSADLAVVWASDTRYAQGAFPIKAAQGGAGCARGVMRYDPAHRARLAAAPPEPELPYPYTREEFAAVILALETRRAFEDAEEQRLDAEETAQQVTFLRDVFGNPFRPATIDPAWLTSTVVALAEGIYAEGTFDRMPILADALQDAGSDNEDVLAHCRDTSTPHVRGCWVVDLLTGRS